MVRYTASPATSTGGSRSIRSRGAAPAGTSRPAGMPARRAPWRAHAVRRGNRPSSCSAASTVEPEVSATSLTRSWCTSSWRSPGSAISEVPKTSPSGTSPHGRPFWRTTRTARDTSGRKTCSTVPSGRRWRPATNIHPTRSEPGRFRRKAAAPKRAASSPSSLVGCCSGSAMEANTCLSGGHGSSRKSRRSPSGSQWNQSSGIEPGGAWSRSFDGDIAANASRTCLASSAHSPIRRPAIAADGTAGCADPAATSAPAVASAP